MSRAERMSVGSETTSEPESDCSFDSTSTHSNAVPQEQLVRRVESLQQENRVLRMELETSRLRVKALQEENLALRKNSVEVHAKAEQEEEYISNTLLKKIQLLKKEKEKLAQNYEEEEECLTNELGRKLTQLRNEKVELEKTLEKEQEFHINKLMKKIQKLEKDTNAKQDQLEKLRKEKVDLENALEQEQEALVNRLWKKMEKLEAEKQMLQEKLEHPVTNPESPGLPEDVSSNQKAQVLTEHVQYLKAEVDKLKRNLVDKESSYESQMNQLRAEEAVIREQNKYLQRKLQLEVERKDRLSRELSESQSSLEIDDERQFNEAVSAGLPPVRPRSGSIPIPGSTSHYHPRCGSGSSGGSGSVTGRLSPHLSASGSFGARSAGSPMDVSGGQQQQQHLPGFLKPVAPGANKRYAKRKSSSNMSPRNASSSSPAPSAPAAASRTSTAPPPATAPVAPGRAHEEATTNNEGAKRGDVDSEMPKESHQE